ncbi:feline leukemia virus subgroup C receptor-related protein 1-like [Frankliniella occidentalis]|uniref:Feline leukemia virus subgroup C receptor-related protein 1-like n=1 Tax=Frankliniella occidentalis TaxID=133901 RepID=A0A6J1S0U2_FRAOC|nr:feline leukemia virus subgroup C receptor-related protein 1-like [Frankliniella occidentalis]
MFSHGDMTSSTRETQSADVRPVGRRWLMLAIFCLVTLTNGCQWVQFSIIDNSVAAYYGTSRDVVDWTSLLFMVTYIPGMLPAAWFLDKTGLRWTVLVAAAGNCLAAWLKVVAVRPDLLAVLFAGQGVAALVNCFVLSVPPRLAAVWFGERQVSTATAIGVIGNQLGNALGFAVPSVLVRAPPPAAGSSLEGIGDDMALMSYIVAGVTTAALLLAVLAFQAAPPLPPSQAMAAALESERAGDGHTESLSQYCQSLKSLVGSPGFPQLLVAYGIINGVSSAAGTLLNGLITSVFVDSEMDAGLIGLTMVVAGLVGSVLFGLLLDATAKFKELTVGVYALSLLAVVVFTGSLYSGKIWTVYVAGAFAGSTLAGYIPVGFEFAAELTYPAPEGTSSGLLSAAGMLMAVVFTLVCERLLPLARGWLWTCCCMMGVLALGAAFTLTIPNNLRRQQAQRTAQLTARE